MMYEDRAVLCVSDAWVGSIAVQERFVAADQSVSRP